MLVGSIRHDPTLPRNADNYGCSFLGLALIILPASDACKLEIHQEGLMSFTRLRIGRKKDVAGTQVSVEDAVLCKASIPAIDVRISHCSPSRIKITLTIDDGQESADKLYRSIILPKRSADRSKDNAMKEYVVIQERINRS